MAREAGPELVDFNPHSRKGSDVEADNNNLIVKISIHTPAKGVTKEFCVDSFAYRISIHTPAKGVTYKQK